MSIKIDPKGPRRSKKDPVRVRKLRQTSQAAFAASSFSSWLFITQFLFVDMPILSYLFPYLNSKALNYHKRWENDGSLSPLQSIELCSQQQPASARQPTARIAKHMARVGMVWCNPPPGEHQRAGELLQGYASSSNFQITIQQMERKGVNCRM